MNQVLSQTEIDNILNAVEASDTPESSLDNSLLGDESNINLQFGLENDELPKEKSSDVKLYDFKRPDKFSKDQIRTIQMIHETYARLTTTSLSAQLRSFVSIQVASVDQLTYEEFSKSIPTPSTLSIINMNPLKGSAIIEMDPNITFTMIDRLFGGEGKAVGDNRELTDIELSVVEGIVIRILGNMRESWSNVIDLRPKLTNIETNIQFAQIVPPNDMVVLITFQTKIGSVEGMTNLCIPYITIESIISKLSAQYWYSSIRKGESQENLDLIKNQIFNVGLNLSAKIGSTSLTVKELLKVKKKDVIRLEVKINDDFILSIGNKNKFNCRPGLVGNNMGVQIISEINEEKQDIKKENKSG